MSYYQLADAQGSIVSVVSAASTTIGFMNLIGGQTLEQLEYEPYGRSRRHTPGDFNHSGTITTADPPDFTGALSATPPSIAADVDDSGIVGIDDANAFLGWYYTGALGPQDTLSGWDGLSGIDNPYGYCGYYADSGTLGVNGPSNGFLYHVRHRVYDPITGRWLQKDPAGFVDGMNLYEYVGGRCIGSTDSLGLVDDTMCSPTTRDEIRKESDEVKREIKEKIERGELPPAEHNPNVEAFEKAMAAFWGVTAAVAAVVVAVEAAPLIIAEVVAAGVSVETIGTVTATGAAVAHSVADPDNVGAGATVGVVDDVARATSGAVKNAENTVNTIRSSANAVAEGIYEFASASGKTYVGQSENISIRLSRHMSDGKLLPKDIQTVETTAEAGGKTAREIAEQMRINELGGVDKLENIRNPIGSARQHLLPKPKK